jgi:hypothetical protein
MHVYSWTPKGLIALEVTAICLWDAQKSFNNHPSPTEAVIKLILSRSKIPDDIIVAFASGLFSRSLEDLVIIYFWIAIISGKHND